MASSTTPHPFAALHDALSEATSGDTTAAAEALARGQDLFSGIPSSLMEVYALQDNLLPSWEERLASDVPLSTDEIARLVEDLGTCWMAVAALAAGKAMA